MKIFLFFCAFLSNFASNSHAEYLRLDNQYSWKYFNLYKNEYSNVIAGIPLSFQLSRIESFLGYYEVEFKIDNDYFSDNREVHAVYIPAVVGFDSCELNDSKLIPIEYKKVAYGVLCVFEAKTFKRINVLKIFINSKNIPFVGFWTGYPEITTLVNGIKKREYKVLFEQHIQLAYAAILFLIALLTFGLPKKMENIEDVKFLNTYRNTLFIWSVYYLSFSGLLRELNDELFSYFHVIVNAAALFSINILILKKSTVSKKYRELYLKSGIFLLFSILILVFYKLYKIQNIIVYYFSYVTFIVVFKFKKQTNIYDKIFYCLCILVSVTGLHDSLKRYFSLLNIDILFPVFLNRFNIVLLLYSVAYIVKNLSEINEKKIASEKQERFALRLMHELKSPLLALNTFKNSLKKHHLSKNEIMLFEMSTEKLKNLSQELKSSVTIKTNCISTLDIKKACNDVYVEKLALWSNAVVFKYEFLLSKEINERVIANSSLLKAVLSNLFDNSLDAISKKENPEIQIKVVSSDSKIILSFIDNGVGVSSEIANKIFEKNFSTKLSSGLGLYFVKKELEDIGADIILDRKYMFGTKFDVILRKLD